MRSLAQQQRCGFVTQRFAIEQLRCDHTAPASGFRSNCYNPGSRRIL
jgi:hypothetical protein